MNTAFGEMIEREYRRALEVPITTLHPHSDVTIHLFRADTLPAGVKTPIGHCLVAEYLRVGKIHNRTKALVIQGSGNTAYAVKEGVDLLGLDVEVLAVVYEATSPHTVGRLQSRGIRVIQESPREAGRGGRQGVVSQLVSENLGYVALEQHEEPLIVTIQERTFGRALAERLGSKVIGFVAGVGTGGTLFGIQRGLSMSNDLLWTYGVEGFGSSLGLWHTYMSVRECGFDVQKTRLEHMLSEYQSAGVEVSIVADPSAPPEEWFDITLDVPDRDDMRGIEGLLGFSEPTDLIREHLPKLRRVELITDKEALEGVAKLGEVGIAACTSAGANYAASLRIAQSMRQEKYPMPHTHLLTIVTAKG